MKIKELKECIENLPDDAEVIIQADHGQHYEYASDTVLTRSNLEQHNDLEEAIFEFADFQNDYYDEDALAEYPFTGEVTGIVIFGD